MGISSYVAASKLMADQQAVENIALNLSSQGVPGFQGNDIIFSSYLKNGISYVEDKAMIRDLSAGPMIQTQDPLHVSIKGPGYFSVQKADGTLAYTRGGVFQLNTERYVVTPSGHYVLDEGQAPIQIPENAQNILIGEDGVVSDQNGQLAKLGVFMFNNEQDMRIDSSGYLTTTQEAQSVTVPHLNQGSYEGSNVNPVLEITKLTSFVRDYERVIKFIQEESDLESKTTDRLIKIV